MSATIGITAPTAAAPVWVLGDGLRFMATLDERDLHVVDTIVPSGSGTPPHRHASIEISRVFAGEIIFGLFDDGASRFVTVGPGTIVTLPSGVRDNDANHRTGTATRTVTVEGQMRNLFRDVAQPVPPPAGPPTPEAIARIMDACRRHGLELLAVHA